MRHGILATAIFVAIVLVALQPTIHSQPTGQLPPGFGQALTAVHNAESAGATANETVGLVMLLNKALDLNREASEPNTTLQQRTALLSEVDQTLGTVNGQAQELAVKASQRAYYNVVFAYVWGVIGAVLGTFAYVVMVSVYREYRIRRTFQMKVTPK